MSKLSLAKSRIGQVFSSKNYGDGEIIDISPLRDKSGNVRFIFKFYETGNVVDISYRNLKLGQFKDYFKPTVLGVGFSYSGASKSHFYKTWTHMLERCYNQRFHAYPKYGGRGVKVSQSWLNFANFEKDCLELDGVSYFLKNPDKYSLDKDEKGCGYLYSKETCKFSSNKKQSTFRSNEYNIVAVNQDGVEILFYSVSDAAKSLNVQNANIYKVLNGERKSTCGYTFKRLQGSFLKPLF